MVPPNGAALRQHDPSVEHRELRYYLLIAAVVLTVGVADFFLGGTVHIPAVDIRGLSRHA
ncbi:MAG: hypothetical protein IPL17_00925 [Anaerolineales bacterium]|nr:hypothetical protein [Anaerolineales bacterium]